MTRRRFRKLAVSPSLFPFLAVLVCTMGALIVLLVLVVQQARVYASSVAEQRVRDEVALDEALQKQQLQQDDYEWQREVFEQQRSDLSGTLSERRLELGHLEDHIRRLEQKWRDLKDQAAQFEQLGSEKHANTEQAAAELKRLREMIGVTGQRLEQARKEAATRPQTFAIVPYDGVNGTKRRPIYIECSEEGITIQPEGIVLRRGDLEGPLGPGNPLDAALRATREHWARQGDTALHGEPYPLLIVRPNGTIAYNYAREALKAWDDEFGYELIDAEMQLAYPDQDAALRDLLQRTVQQARERQAILIAAMPSQYDQSSIGGGYVATPTRGGFQPLGGTGTMAGAGSGFGEAGQGGGSQEAAAYGDSSFRTEGSNSASSGGSNGGPSETHADNQSSQNGAGQGGPPSEATSGTGGPLGSGGTQAAGGVSSAMARRGANWAVPKAAAGATAYQIPVRIVCQFDRLTILPRPSDNASPIEVPAADPLSKSIDEFVKLMWKQIEQWDAAPLGGYWQPVLEVYVHPGAEGRFAELKSLLSGSGIQVQRQAQ
ncbi:MAG: hypothetical protein H6822_33220 [Planctomycetaceae bacterium]|nr:hypothetical protein [Planctomycetales bacterium]MCB9927048.1 hypothetical protein [Planctomycetaceae bacterium]